jgi:hypothetical protein
LSMWLVRTFQDKMDHDVKKKYLIYWDYIFWFFWQHQGLSSGLHTC